MAEFDGVAAPDLVPGRLRGYRAWQLIPVSVPQVADTVEAAPPAEAPRLHLAAVSQGTVWPLSMTLDAECLASHPPQHPKIPAPHGECRCGIYAWYGPTAAHGYDSPDVVGVVETWGKVLLGTRGYRAQHARVVAVSIRNVPGSRFGMGLREMSRMVDALGADLSAAGVRVFPDEMSMLAEFPPDPPLDLLGAAAEVVRGPVSALTALQAAASGSAAFSSFALAITNLNSERERRRRYLRTMTWFAGLISISPIFAVLNATIWHDRLAVIVNCASFGFGLGCALSVRHRYRKDRP